MKMMHADLQGFESICTTNQIGIVSDALRSVRNEPFMRFGIVQSQPSSVRVFLPECDHGIAFPEPSDADTVATELFIALETNQLRLPVQSTGTKGFEIARAKYQGLEVAIAKALWVND